MTVRNDTGVYEGGEISLFYDPMIAKLVTHASTRGAAINAQSDALDRFVIDGIRHNVPFLAALMAHPRWQAGKLTTGFIAEEFPGGFHARVPEGQTQVMYWRLSPPGMCHQRRKKRHIVANAVDDESVECVALRIDRRATREGVRHQLRNHWIIEK